MHFSEKPEYYLNRRRVLKLGICAVLTGMAPVSTLSAAVDSFHSDKSVSLYNVHTGESLRAVYWSGGKYDLQALDDIKYILRDFRTGVIRDIHPDLLDFLSSIRDLLGTRQYFHIVSGYRSPATNELLRKSSGGVAKNSMHLYGKAVDFRVPARDLELVRRAAISLQCGGVGYYPDSDFVHVDVGEVRTWCYNRGKKNLS